MINFLLQGGYNGLSDIYNKTNNYKYVASIENRYYDNLLGVFAQVDVERKNLSSNEFGATYTAVPFTTNQYLISGFTLNDIPRDRLRYNGAVVLDYQLPEGKLKFTTFLSSGNTDVQNRSETYNINSGTTSNQHIYSFAYSGIQLSQISNTLEYDQVIPIFHVNAKFSHTYSETKDPNDWTASFTQTSAGLRILLMFQTLILLIFQNRQTTI